MAILIYLEIAHNKVSTPTCGNGLVCFASSLAAPFQKQNFQALLWKTKLHLGHQGDCMDPVNREKVGQKKETKKNTKGSPWIVPVHLEKILTYNYKNISASHSVSRKVTIIYTYQSLCKCHLSNQYINIWINFKRRWQKKSHHFLSNELIYLKIWQLQVGGTLFCVVLQKILLQSSWYLLF